MKKPIIITSLIVLLTCGGLSGCASDGISNQDLGMVAGGVTGGLVGNAISNGSTAGTIVGAVGGAWLGREIGKKASNSGN